MDKQTNVLGEALAPCSRDPLTGFYRDGCCRTGPEDGGAHVVCAVMTGDFLAFSRRQGNDLVTPRPEYGFPGLKPGDQWCLCASRWEEARRAGCAPQVQLVATHREALQYARLEHLLAHAVDAPAQDAARGEG
ncbi:MAG: DUF2237 family protein [Maricaulaceae bacterium]